MMFERYSFVATKGRFALKYAVAQDPDGRAVIVT